eukprot:SAG11_NODE_11265_length_772_cov_1.254086_2_plen_56_part_01
MNVMGQVNSAPAPAPAPATTPAFAPPKAGAPAPAAAAPNYKSDFVVDDYALDDDAG